MRIVAFVTAAAVAVAVAGGAPARGSSPPAPMELAVAAGSDLSTLEDAIRLAAPGATIKVMGGVHPAVVIDKSVTLVGEGSPVIDAGGRGTAVKVTAPDVSIEGFVVRNTGISLDREDSGIVVEAPRVRLVQNTIEDALFGIYLKQAPNSLVIGNTIRGKSLPEPRRGDGIRIWYSPAARVAENRVEGARDVILWFSGASVVEGNVVRGGRYGIHLMYNDDTTIRANEVSHNSVGIFAMYSAKVSVIANDVRTNRGPSGFGLGLKDLDDVTVSQNRIQGNRVGVFLDNTPRLQAGAKSEITHNRFEANDIGMTALASIRGNLVRDNAFLDNIQQVAVMGGSGLHRHNAFSEQGRGNYWSDYAGYDGDGDGVGDLPYESSSLFESWMDEYPVIRWYLMSPAMSAVDLAVRAFPAFRPPAKVVDTAPLVSIPQGTPSAGGGVERNGADPGMLALSASLVAMAVAAGASLAAGRRANE